MITTYHSSTSKHSFHGQQKIFCCIWHPMLVRILFTFLAKAFTCTKKEGHLYVDMAISVLGEGRDEVVQHCNFFHHLFYWKYSWCLYPRVRCTKEEFILLWRIVPIYPNNQEKLFVTFHLILVLHPNIGYSELISPSRLW